MSFEDSGELTASDIPKVLLGFAVALALWPTIFPPSHPLLAKYRLQSHEGTLHRIEQSDPVRYQAMRANCRNCRSSSAQTSLYIPGSTDLYVETGGSVREFSLDNREASRYDGLERLRPGDDVSLLVEPVASGQDRLWELKRGNQTIIDYSDTRTYVEQVYGDPPFWCRVFATLLLLAGIVSAMLLRKPRRLPAHFLHPPHIDEDEHASSGPGDVPEELPPIPWQQPPPFVAGSPDAPEAESHPDESVVVVADAHTIPPALADTAESHPIPVLLSLLLDDDLDTRVDQQIHVREQLGLQAFDSLHAVAPAIGRLSPTLRLPLAELALPALRAQPATVTRPFLDCVDAMVRMDGAVGLFKYCVGRMAHRQIADAAAPAGAQAGRRSPRELRIPIGLLMATIARIGQDSQVAAQRAYSTGMNRILPGEAIAYAPPSGGLGALDGVWDALDTLDADAKSSLVAGLIAAIGSDGNTTIAETQLLHAVCTLLHSPLPTKAEPQDLLFETVAEKSSE